jgi:glycine cleavage system H protein
MSSPETYPDDLLYHPEHDWVRIVDGEATFGITWYAQNQLGEIVFVDGAKVGDEVVQGEPYVELESVKAVSEVIAPLSGRIVAVNEAAADEPDSVNRSPYEEGWLVRVAAADPAEQDVLLSPAAYRELIA